jgi:hypothetical protein
MKMNGQAAKVSDKIGELWSELQKTEERLRTVGGGISTPAMDCFVNETLKDPFDATVFTALSDADVKARIGAAQPAVEAMVAAVVADIDGKGGMAQLSPLFSRGGAQLAPMAVIEGAHSQWTAGAPVEAFAASPEPAAKPSPRERLAETAVNAKRKPYRVQSSTDALSAGFDTPSAHAVPPSPKSVRGKLMSSSDALHSAIAPAPEALKADPDIGPQLYDAKVPEPRAHRDLPSAVRARADAKIKPIEKKRPLWLRILWG